MQRFDRSTEPPPAWFTGSEADQFRQALTEYFNLSADRRAQTDPPRAPVPLDGSVAMGLARLFNGKCAFCERRVSTQAYRFRPPGEATPASSRQTSHLYYVWLATAWENIYPICAECVPADPGWFPVRSRRAPIPQADRVRQFSLEGSGLWRAYPPKERPLLIEPCVQEDYAAHFQATVAGELLARSDRGAETIRHFRLDRIELVAARREAFDVYARLLVDSVRTDKAPGRPFDFPQLIHGGAWYLLVRRLVHLLGAEEGVSPSLTPLRLVRYFNRLPIGEDTADRVVWALEHLAAQDRAAADPAETPLLKRSEARLTHVTLSNFRGVEALEFAVGAPSPTSGAPDPVAPRHAPALLILGENATGKSTILEGVALALSSPTAHADLGLSTAAVASYRLDPGQMGAGRRKARTGEVRLTFDDGRDRVLMVGPTGLLVEGRADLPPVFGYGAFRQYRESWRRHGPAKGIMNLFHSDWLLSNPETWLAGLKKDDFQMVVRTLRTILSIEGDFEVIERAKGRCVVVASTPGPEGTLVKTRTPFAMVSSGYRAVLGTICDVLAGLMDSRVNPGFENFATARAVVLIDEIEAHLHPRWKMQIMRSLRTALPQVTFIATTHDPLCLRGMEDGEVLVLHRIAGAETEKTDLPVFVEQLTSLPNVTQLTVEQLLTSDFFSLISTDAPEAERELATVADLLALQAAGAVLSDGAAATLQRFRADVASALPVGASEVQRIVHEAVADYLKAKREASAERLERLRADTKRRIVRALESL